MKEPLHRKFIHQGGKLMSNFCRLVPLNSQRFDELMGQEISHSAQLLELPDATVDICQNSSVRPSEISPFIMATKVADMNQTEQMINEDGTSLVGYAGMMNAGRVPPADAIINRVYMSELTAAPQKPLMVRSKTPFVFLTHGKIGLFYLILKKGTKISSAGIFSIDFLSAKFC